MLGVLHNAANVVVAPQDVTGAPHIVAESFIRLLFNHTPTKPEN